VASSPMQLLTERWGLKFYWADPEHRFTRPGLYVWVPFLKRHVRLLAARA
jgi:hypothetical protein